MGGEKRPVKPSARPTLVRTQHLPPSKTPGQMRVPWCCLTVMCLAVAMITLDGVTCVLPGQRAAEGGLLARAVPRFAFRGWGVAEPARADAGLTGSCLAELAQPCGL